MSFQTAINQLKNQPRQLEELYQAACQQGAAQQFQSDLVACLADDPENLVLQAWQHRLQASPAAPTRRLQAGINWWLAIIFAVLNGLVLWILSDPSFELRDGPPIVVVLAAPVTALFVVWFLTLASRRNVGRALLATGGLGLVSAAGSILYFWSRGLFAEQYLIMIILHLALLAWVGVGVLLVGLEKEPAARFAFLIKSLEVFVVGGVYLIAGMIFGSITLGMFQALSITLPEWIMRLVVAGGAGLLPILAVATSYQPAFEVLEQDFQQGLSKFVTTLMRLLLPMTLMVLVVYIFIIPFNFLEPFKNRDVLIVYNAMLFAIMALVAGATPLDLHELSPRLALALRTGILAVAGLAALVSLYALSALLYRTIDNGITLNRLIMLGWNGINISLLILMIVRLLKKSDQPWNARIKAIYSLGAVPYVVWALFVILATPFIFR